MTPLVLDAGALIALERGDRTVELRVKRARAHGQPMWIPAGCLAQAWRDGKRQAMLAALLKMRMTRVPELDRQDARRVGELLAGSGTADVVDAHLALVALRIEGTVLTSDPDDIRRLAPTVRVVAV
jgi:hypothetical protein